MDIEKERGITIKAQTAALQVQGPRRQVYNLNLIDTPGHVDFSYEVSRSLSACEGALLVVDASQGVEAQTVANCYTALDLGVEVVPVLNKMDLPNADPDNAKAEIEDVIGIDATDAIPCSAKTGMGIDEILEAVVARCQRPGASPGPLRAMIIDSWFDSYVGVVMLVRVVDGRLLKGERIKMMATGRFTTPTTWVCSRRPTSHAIRSRRARWATSLPASSELQAAKVGDTVTLEKKLPNNRARPPKPLPGFKEIQPQVFAGLYPTEASEYDSLRDALEKLKLNDASLALRARGQPGAGLWLPLRLPGFVAHGDRAGAAGARVRPGPDHHRAQRGLPGGPGRRRSDRMVENPSKMPDQGRLEEIREPIVTVHLYMPQEYVGPVMTLANQKRGVQMNMAYHGRQVMLTYEMPLGEIVLDFFDKLKSVSRGYASMDYEFKEYRASDVVKVDILLNGEKVDALSIIVHRSQSQYRGRAVVAKMREIISRQMYDVAIQAAIGANIIARETIKALRKNVLAKCYGGDITRKRKLLEKQKAGKKRMKQIGSVEVPQEAFLAICRWKIDAISDRADPCRLCRLCRGLVFRRWKAISRCCCSWPRWSPACTGWPSVLFPAATLKAAQALEEQAVQRRADLNKMGMRRLMAILPRPSTA
jgi:GTP-binding protein LepA